MGFWPFGGAKKKQSPVGSTKHARDQSTQSDPSENMGRLEKASTDLTGGTRSSSKQEDKTRRLSKNRIPAQQQQRFQTAPLPVPNTRRHSHHAQTLSEKQLYQHNPTSQSSLGPENFNVVRPPPTLYARKSEQDTNINRRKSSKRKAEDYAREREVKAMSSSPIPIPRRPTSFYGSGPLQKETKDIPGPLNRRLNRPSSQVSLPLPDVLQDINDVSYQHNFKIGMFAALSPRPTIKYDANPKHLRGKQPQRQQAMSVPILEEDPDAHKKRIDDLADELDANGLRELMERDRRRRERKKQKEQAVLQRKLERRADRQREEEARRARTEEYVSAAASRVAVDTTSPTIARDEDTSTGPSGTRPKVDPFQDPKSATSPTIRNPFEDEQDMDVMEEDQPLDIEAEPPIPVRSPLRKIQTNTTKPSEKPSHGTLSPPISPLPRAQDRQSMSQGSLLNREATADRAESASLTGGASDHSSQRLNSWTTFFKRGTRRKLSSSFQGRTTPSEFSNTSRESFARKQPPPVVVPRTFRPADAGTTPQRTMSKFREDLPELPLSPPDSRMQSPETAAPPATSSFNRAVTTIRPVEGAINVLENTLYTPSSPIPAGTRKAENEPPVGLDVPTSPRQDMILSQSLASVDSEGSWLSGKPLNRRSGALGSRRLQKRGSSLTRAMPGGFDGANETDTPLESPETRPVSADPLEEAIKKDETWHAGVGRQPTVVRQASRAKSKEGLLKEFKAQEEQASDSDTSDEADEVAETPEPEPEPVVTLGRAQSVEYKGHARHISGGSARLLDIRRSSTQSGDLLSRSASTAGVQKQVEVHPPPVS